METRANYIIVGLFTLIVLALSFVFIYWVAKIDERVNLVPVSVKIRGAVTGLSSGSEVHFNGIKVGKVSRIVFDPEDPSIVSALIRIDENTPIRKDTKATIASNGLSGTALVALTGGSIASPSLLNDDSLEGAIPSIEATPSAFADIVETVRDVATKANNTLASIEGLVSENRQPLTQTLKNVEVFSQSLARNSEGVDKFLASTANLGETISTLSAKLDGTIAGIEKVVGAVEPAKVATIINNAESFSQDLKNTGNQIEGMLGSVEKVSKDLEKFSANLNTSLAKLDGVIGAVEPANVKSTIADISEAAAGAKQLVADARQITQTLAGRKDDINKIVTDAAQMAERLNASSARVDGVLAKLDGFLGSGDASGIMTDARSTLLEFRNVATNLNARINQISGGINQFTSTGLKDVQSLVNDSRRSINRIERVINSLERDPSGFLFGKSGVKTYKGRPRR